MEFTCERCKHKYEVPDGWDSEIEWASDLALKAPLKVMATDPDTDQTAVVHECAPEAAATDSFYFIGSESPTRSVGRHLVSIENLPGETATALCGAVVTTMDIDWLPRGDDCAYCLRKLPQ